MAYRHSPEAWSRSGGSAPKVLIECADYVVEATESAGAKHRALLDGCELVAFPMRTNTLVAAVEHALGPG